MKILCVDDERLVLELAVSMCQALPQKPETVGFTRASEALEWLNTNAPDAAILDINMPDMDGLTLAANIKNLRPDTAIIFLTGYSEYAVDAFAMHASGYLLKPVSAERLRAEIEYALSARRQQQFLPQTVHVLARTFGEFDLYVDGEIVDFPRAKAKELLAYLIDRQGGSVSRAAAFSVLWEKGTYDRSAQKQLDVIIRSLRTTLEEYGVGELLELRRGVLRIHPEKLDCDLYHFLDGDMTAVNAYRGVYMNAYSWASLTEGRMSREEK